MRIRFLIFLISLNVMIGLLMFLFVNQMEINVTNLLPTSLLRGQDVYFPPRWENAPVEHFTKQFAWEEMKGMMQLDNQGFNTIKEDNYCQKRREYIMSRNRTYGDDGLPIKEDRHVYTLYTTDQWITKELAKFLTLELQNQKFVKEARPIPPSVDLVMANHYTWALYHQLGRHFLCDSSQRYNMVPGGYHMANKDEVVELAREYGKYFEGREHCYTPWDFIPKTYIMWDPEDCKEIIEIISQQTTNDIKYMGKIARGSHRGEGISLITLDEIAKLQEKYDYGKGCDAKQKDKFVIQKYIPQPFLINGRKMDFRCFMIIASAEPLIVFYQDGLIRLAHDDFDEHSTDITAHLTNLSVTKGNLGDKTKEEAMAESAWTMQQFEDYLIENNIVDEEWFEEVMVPNMKRIIMHTVRSVSERILRHPGVFEMWGIDFLLDADLNLWLMEVTPIPDYSAATPAIGELKLKIKRDLIDMEFALMDNNWDLFDKIQSQSTFQYVYDGRKTGMERYHGILTPDCVQLNIAQQGNFYVIFYDLLADWILFILNSFIFDIIRSYPNTFQKSTVHSDSRQTGQTRCYVYQGSGSNVSLVMYCIALAISTLLTL